MKAREWVQAFRIKFLPQGIMPVLLGTVIAYRVHGVFLRDLFVLAFLGMALVQFGLTMLDDWHDYMRGTDRTSTREKNPYTGGSGVLVDGTISPKEMVSVVALFYIIATAIGLYLTYLRGMMIFYIMITGFFISIFYSLRPFQFAYRGMGEFMMLLGYGPTITLGAYYVQAQALDLPAFLAGLLPGMLMWAMIVVNEIPDYEEDLASGKRNLVVMFGKESGVRLFSVSLLLIYFYIGSLAAIGFFPPGTLISLLSIVFAWRAVGQLKVHYLDKVKIVVANREMVKTYSATTILFTAGFLL